MIKQVFAINISHGNLTLKQGYVYIPYGGYTTIFEEDVLHPDFKDALAKKWLKISETEPKKEELNKPPVVEVFEPNKGLSAEELKAELAKDSTEDTGSSESIGVPVEPAQEQEVASEEVKKPGRRSAK